MCTRLPIEVFLCVTFVSLYGAHTSLIQDQLADSSKRHALSAIAANLRMNEAQECMEDIPDVCPKKRIALDQPCSSDTECIAPAVCAYQRCQCPKNFIKKHSQCIVAPSFNQACPDSHCMEPFVCNETIKLCDCPGFMKKSLYGCTIECAQDEVAVKTTCERKAEIDKPCNSSLQCVTAYSQCISGQCQCVPGSEKKENSCQPAYRCPDGSVPIQSNGAVLKCTPTTCKNPSKPMSDTCPPGAFCVFPSYQNLEGFCCPEKSWCPTGAPLPGKNCKNPKTNFELCPPETHHCFSGPHGTSCCPLPCPSIIGTPAVVVNGQCYAKRQLNENCLFNEQCPLNAVCSEGRKCECPQGFTVQYSATGGIRCRRICAGNEKLVGTDCLPMAVPLGVCQHSAQCTGGTKCKGGICQCPCGKILYNGQCITKPSCPEFASLAGGKEPMMSKTGSYIECSLQDLVSSGQCPSRSFCVASRGHLAGGVCCPFPDPTCAANAVPERGSSGEPLMCNLTGEATCSIGHYCRDYMAAALPWSRMSEGVCCPNVNLSPVPSIATINGNENPCPQRHVLARDASGDAVTCNYFGYSGECGDQAGCFYANPGFLGIQNGGGLQPVNLLFSNRNTGFCCNWNKQK